MDFVKKEWQFRDLITEGELNRMEDGIEEGITKAEQAQDDLAAHTAATTGVHGATSEATPNRIVIRDANGNISVGNATEGNHALNRIVADERYAQKNTTNEFTAGQIFAGNFPIIMQGRSAEDVPGKRTYRFDVYQDLLRIQALDDNYEFVRLLLDINHDGTFLRLGDTPYIFICKGAGSPQGNVFAPPGSIYLNTNGGAGTTLWVKESGTGNTGWVAIGQSVPIETGAWTPELRFAGSTTGITYVYRAGLYTKIANVVYWSFEIALSSKGSASGTAMIDGLPFYRGNNSYFYHAVGRASNISVPSGQWLSSYISGTTVLLTTNIGSFISNTNFANDSTLYTSGFYFI